MFSDESGDELAQMMRLAHHVHNRLHASLSEIGLYRGQPPILRILARGEHVSQKEIADALGLSPATITVTLKRMEKAGLIVRMPDSLDQRVQRVEITARGREMDEKALKHYMRVHAECLACLTPEERADYRGLTDKILAALDGEE